MSISIWYRIPNRSGTHKLDITDNHDNGRVFALAARAWDQLRQGGFLVISPRP